MYQSRQCRTATTDPYGPHAVDGLMYRVRHNAKAARRLGLKAFYICSNHIHHYRNSSFQIDKNPVIDLQKKDFIYDEPARYIHRDRCCVYLGRFNEYDLYYCEGILTKTVLARYSSDPSEYLSGWGSRMAPLAVAEALAYRKELVTPGRVG